MFCLERRIYFRQGDEFDARPERDIVGDRRPPTLPGAERLAGMRDLLDQVGVTVGCSLVNVEALALRSEASAWRAVRIGPREYPNTSHKTDLLYRRVGYDLLPSDWRITVIPVDGVDGSVAEQWRITAQDGLAKRRAKATVRVASESIYGWLYRRSVDLATSLEHSRNRVGRILFEPEMGIGISIIWQ